MDRRWRWPVEVRGDLNLGPDRAFTPHVLQQSDLHALHRNNDGSGDVSRCGGERNTIIHSLHPFFPPLPSILSSIHPPTWMDECMNEWVGGYVGGWMYG